MSVNRAKKDIQDNSTQRYLPFSQIKENIVIMKDSSARVILKCSTINFLLKSTEEQDAIIMSYQRFLNAIDFPVEIMVRSTKLDIGTYLNKLSALAVNQKNPLLQNQTYEYIAYLKKLIEVAQIMKKDFYMIIPFDYVENKSVKDNSFFGVFTNFWNSINGKDDILKIRSQIRTFSNLKKGLLSRTSTVKTSLESIGIKAVELEKHDLVKFLADYYNPTMENFVSVKSDIENYNLT